MSEAGEKLTGAQVTWKMQTWMAITVAIGVPIVQMFMVYLVGGGLGGLWANRALFLHILAVSSVIVVIAVIFHGLYIKHSLVDLSDYLDHDQPLKNETPEAYNRRIVRAIVCTLQYPVKGAGLSLITWPSVLFVVMLYIWFIVFKYPTSLAMVLVGSALCAGVLVTNFQFYIFKRVIAPVQRRLLVAYPDYWKEQDFQSVRMSIRLKMMISIISLMMMIVSIAGIFSNLEGAKALLSQWGQFEKSRILREYTLLGLNAAEATTPEQRIALVDTLNNRAGAKYYLIDKSGNSLLPGNISATEQYLLYAMAARSFKIQNRILLLPLPAENDLALAVEAGDYSAVVRVDLPKSDMIMVASSSFKRHLSSIAKMATTTIVVLVMALFIGFFFAKVAAEDITRPLHIVLDSVKRISRGELTEEMKMITGDEMGVLSVNFKTMIENLRTMILKIKGASSRVEGATLKIVEGFSKISDGSNVQAKAVDETSASMTEMNASIRGISESVETLVNTTQESSASIMEMSSNIKEVADSADHLNVSVEETTSSITQMATSIRLVAENIENLSRKAESTVSSVTEMESSISQVRTGAKETAQASELAAANAEGGKAQVQSTIEGITQARQSSEQAVKVIQALARRAEQIGDILTVINDVTDRTNLLALNAAIIAAQAGEHGRGFAVVADEMKRLSEQTSDSTGEISQLISAVQKEAKQAVEAVRHGYEVVEAGEALSRKAGDALDKILDSAQKSMERAQEIARATGEQGERAREVLQFFEEISESIAKLETATHEQSNGSVQIIKNAERMRDITKQVKRATQEEYGGSKQIIKGIENINEIINFVNRIQSEHIENSERIVAAVSEIRNIAAENQKGTEEMFQASANLSSLAEELRDMVGAFKVEDGSE